VLSRVSAMPTLRFSNRLLLSAVVILLSTLACGQYVGTPTPVPTPTPPRPTPSPSAVPTDTPRATEAASSDTAVVLPVYLNVRQFDGTATDKYLRSGDVVTLTGECKDKWCPILSGDVVGWVYQGCLSEVAGELRCEAMP
jgi:hypothetical protein